MKTTRCLPLTALVFAASFPTALAQTLLWSDDFSNPSGWSIARCQTSYANQQCALFGNFGPTPINNPTATYGYIWHAVPSTGPLPDGQTLAARVDLVSANQPELWADVAFFSPGGNDYHLFMDEDEVGLLKGSGSLFSFLF